MTVARRAGWIESLRYRFDRTLSAGSGALILWLALVTLAFVSVMGVLLHVVAKRVGLEDAGSSLWGNYFESSWQALMRTLDPGTFTGDETWPYRFATLMITIAGIFIFSTLIGLIASVIDRTIEELRKGRGIVAERDHVLVLGWSDKLHAIISELRIAGANQRDSCIVVLAPRDRVDMEDEINARFGGSLAMSLLTGKTALGMLKRVTRTSRGNMRIVCRTGDPADPSDLAIVAPVDSRSIVVLSDGTEDGDAHTLKVLLALLSFDPQMESMDVTVELATSDTAEAVAEVTHGTAKTVVSSDLVSRITAQVCRQAGLGAVFQELLDFDGDELYFVPSGRLSGASYGQALLSLEESSPIGLRRADGTIELNPPMNARIGDGDALIAISEDDDTAIVRQVEEWDSSSGTPPPAAPVLEPDHLLLIGWNDSAVQMLAHLMSAASDGSTIDIAVDPALVQLLVDDLPARDGVTLRVLERGTHRSADLERLLSERSYERVVLLGYRDVLSIAQADARTLLTLVHARRILVPGHRNRSTSIVTELLDTRSVVLGEMAQPDDFVVSERLTSLLLAQLAENSELSDVFAELLDGDGVEVVLQPVDGYVPRSDDVPGHDASGDRTVEYRQLVRAARERGETAIGVWHPPAMHGGSGKGAVVNPAKTTMLALEPGAQIIVLADMRGGARSR